MSHTLNTAGHYNRRTRLRSVDRRLSIWGNFCRIVLMGSLYLNLRGISDADDETLERLNASLHVVSRVDALRLPAILNQFLWRNAKLSSYLEETEMLSNSDFVEYLASYIPNYARYRGYLGDIEKVLADYLRTK